jgi:hypothetical protein
VKELSDAMYARIQTDSTLVGMAGAWASGRSILTRRPVPDSAARPVILLADQPSDVPSRPGTLGLGLDGRLVARTVAVYGSEQSQYPDVVEMAERLRTLFHRRPLTGMQNWTNVIALVHGPFDAPATPGDVARAITVTFELRRVMS